MSVTVKRKYPSSTGREVYSEEIKTHNEELPKYHSEQKPKIMYAPKKKIKTKPSGGGW